MQKINWKFVAEAIGISAIVASLIFVGLQIRQDQRVAAAQVNMSLLEVTPSINSTKTEHADVWVKARNSQDLSETEIEVIQGIIQTAQSRAFFEVPTRDLVSGEPRWGLYSETRGPIMAFSIMLFENPGARKIWTERAARVF